MKKISYFIITMIVFIAIGLCSCKSTELEMEVTDESENEKQAAQENGYTDFDSIDWSADHLECSISKKFTISADIIPESVYEGEFGLYHYEKQSVESRETEEAIAFAEELKTVIADWLGTNEGDFFAVDDKKVTWSYNSGKYNRVLNWYYQELEVDYPLYPDGYDQQQVEKIVEETLEACSNFLSYDQYTWECVWYGEDLYESVKSFYEDNGVEFEESAAWSLINYTEDQERIEIVLRPELDHGIFFSRVYNIETANSYVDNTICITLDRDYNIMAIDGSNYFLIDDDPFDSAEIISLKDAFEQFYNDCNKGSNYQVIDVTLYYGVYEDATGDFYMAPYWIFTWYKKGKYNTNRTVYSALDGALLYGDPG